MNQGPMTVTPNFWTCPALAALGSPDIVDTQYLVANAFDPEQGAAVFPCLWLRGCPPLGFIQVLTPAPLEETFRYLDAKFSGWWPSGTLWTDVSGGTFGSFKRLCRCGVSIASLSTGSGPVNLDWGAWGPLQSSCWLFPGESCVLLSSPLSGQIHTYPSRSCRIPRSM